MSLSTALRKYSIPAWMKYCGMSAAGIAVYFFVASIETNVWPNEGETERQRTTLHDTADAHTAHSVGKQSLAQQGSSEPHAPSVDPPARRNPFSPLSLWTSVGQEAQGDASATPELRQASAGKRRHKARPVSPAVLPPAPVQAQVPIPEPEPAAPSLPFKVLGTIQGNRIADGKTIVFLQDHAVLYVVHAGDEINKIYSVKNISDDRIEFVYLPLQKTQSLALKH